MAAKLQHLLLATLENTAHPMAWSGSALEIRRALAGAVDRLTVLDHLPVKKSPGHSALRLILGGNPPRYPLWMTKPALREFARRTAEAIELHRPQALLSISSQCLVYLPEFYRGPSLPIFSFTDTPWMAFHEVYRDYDPAPVGGKLFAARERAAARRCTGLVYVSQWAKDDAIRRFDVPPERVHVQPMGAAWVPDLSEAAIEAAVRARPTDRVDLLFVGKEWDRKGGELALAIARALHKSGRGGKVRLNIVGCRPKLEPGDHEIVEVFGLLARNDAAQSSKLRELLLASHFLVVPTLAECFGLVFAEAQAFALPPVSRAIVGVPSVILDGKTGIVQPKDDGPEPYVRRILELLEGDRGAYLAMALAGRRHFCERLNWPVFGAGIAALIGAHLAPATKVLPKHTVTPMRTLFPVNVHGRDVHGHDARVHRLGPVP